MCTISQWSAGQFSNELTVVTVVVRGTGIIFSKTKTYVIINKGIKIHLNYFDNFCLIYIYKSPFSHTQEVVSKNPTHNLTDKIYRKVHTKLPAQQVCMS